MKHPKISIIIPVYNIEDYLDECIHSIISQSFKDFEIILVNDGSTDSCPQKCDSYVAKDRRIKVIHKKNGGQAEARNTGLQAVTLHQNSIYDHYIAFVDGDDRLSENSLERLYQVALNTNADVVMASMRRFSNTGLWRPYTRLHKELLMSGKEALRLILEGNLLNISMCTGLFRYEIIKNINIPVGWILEDWLVTPNIFLNANSVIFTPINWYEYRDNPLSTMGELIRVINPQVIDVAENVITNIKNEDRELYKKTLWSNLRRVWKYVGIIYMQKNEKRDDEFLKSTRQLLKKYLCEILSYKQMNIKEIIGVLSFCYSMPVFKFIFWLKNKQINA